MVAGWPSNFSARKRAKAGLIAPMPTGVIAYSAAIAKARSGSSAVSDLRIKPFDFQAAVARAGLRPDGMPRTEGASGVQGGFRTAMADALKDVSKSQMEASRLQR